MSLEDFQAFVDQVRAANPIEEVIGGYAKIERKGQQLWCSAPYRGDKDPSLAIYPDQGSWYDFGEQNGGDCYDLIGRMENKSFREAVDFLAAKAGLSWGGGSNGGTFEPEVEAEITRLIERRRIAKLQDEATIYYSRKLPRHIRQHFIEHYGFTPEFIKEARIGWADGTLQVHLDDLGYEMADMLKSGLFIRTQGGRVFELHEDRATIPYPVRGSYPYMISRRIEGETPDVDYQKAKYKKSLTKSDKHPYVHPSVRNDVFYGEDSARHGGKLCIVTEGVTDAGSALMHGFCCISPVTVRFRDQDHDKLIDLTKDFELVAIINDAEEPKIDPRTGRVSQPGLEGALKTAAALYRAGRNVKIVQLPKPDGAAKIDLNEYLRDNSKADLEKLIKGSLSYVEFLIERVPRDIAIDELDQSLLPIYEAVSTCTGKARTEAYINKICKRFGLTKKTVRESVKEFSKSGAGTSATTGSSGEGDDPPPSGKRKRSERPPQTGELIEGHVYEDIDDCFYYIFFEESIKRLSNFLFTPKRRIFIDGGIRLICDIEMDDGKTFEDVLLPAASLTSSRDFVRFLQGICFGIAWSGKDSHVQGLAELLYAEKLPINIGVPQFGYHESKDGPRIVLPNMIIGPDGPVDDSPLIYAPRVPDEMAEKIDMRGLKLPKDTVDRMMQRVMPALFDLHTPETILVLMNWFAASAATPVFRRVLGHFPILEIVGSPGSGKTALCRDIFMRFAGITDDLMSCSDTKFAMMSTLACTSSFPVPLDEFKYDIPQRQREVILALWRKNYVGGNEQRGRADQRKNRYHLLAPIVVLGAMMSSDPAMLERVVVAYPYKTDLTNERREAMLKLMNEELTLLAGPFLQWLCGRDIEADIKAAKAAMAATYLPMLSSQLPLRIADNLLVIATGDIIHRKWCEHCGVDISKRPKLIDWFQQIVANITESIHGGQVRDGFDLLLESLSTLVQLGLIKEGIHYAIVGSQLRLHLESCHAIYLAEQRRRGLSDETNGLKALQRTLSEKMLMTDSYVTNTSIRTKLMSDLIGISRQVRTVSINQDLVPSHLSFEPFPAKYDRRSGKTGWDDPN